MQFCKAKANLIYLSPALDPALKMLQVRRTASELDNDIFLLRSPSFSLSLSSDVCVVVIVVGSEFRCCAKRARARRTSGTRAGADGGRVSMDGLCVNLQSPPTRLTRRPLRWTS